MNNIPVNEPLLNGNEEKYLIECIRSGWISSEGPFVKKFEDDLSNKINRKHGIAVCNGSVALDLALKVLNLQPGDEVILPTFTIISCATAILRAGAIPVLIDSDPLTWNMDVSKLEDKITDKTKAIMVVHIYGLPVDMDPVIIIAKKYNLLIIEDAAEMHGQLYKNKPCGSFGDISIFSFYPNKHITTGEGGMIFTNNENLANKCRLLRNLAFNDSQRFKHDELGWNYRMTNLQAAIGVAQLERLDEFVLKKRHIGTMYNNLLKSCPHIQLPICKTEYSDNIYWVFGLVISSEINLDAKDLMKMLHERGIGSRPFFYPMHLQPIFIQMGLFVNQDFPVANNLSKKGLYLPSGLATTDAQIIQVTNILLDILKEY